MTISAGRMAAIRDLAGWKRAALAMLLGACASLALPPFYVTPLLIPAFSGLVLLTLARRPPQAFWDGWWWGLGHFILGVYWICVSFWVEPEKFAWLTPFALLGLPGVLAVYTGLVCALLRALNVPPRLSLVAFAAIWTAVEWLRAHLFTGFPWNLLGYAWTVSDVSLQTASLVGIYGLSFLTILIAAAPALFFLEKRPWPPMLAITLLLGTCIGFGIWRLAQNPTHYTSVTLRLVQANLDERARLAPDSGRLILRRHALLTRRPGWQNVRLFVWPEAAIPYFLAADSPLARDLGSLLPPGGVLITGALRGRGDARDWTAWNSVFAVDAQGGIVARYDKHHLVPFGEYIPVRRLLSNLLPLENITGGMGDFSRGPGPATLLLRGYPAFSPLICYEAIFPGEIADGSDRARWLLNVTNDAWFGNTSGPYQHLQMARTRAVEEGLPLVRAANTGVSAVFDPYGRELARLPLNSEGILDTQLPAATEEKPLTSRHGGAGVLTLILTTAVVLALLPR